MSHLKNKGGWGGGGSDRIPTFSENHVEDGNRKNWRCTGRAILELAYSIAILLKYIISSHKSKIFIQKFFSPRLDLAHRGIAKGFRLAIWDTTARLWSMSFDYYYGSFLNNIEIFRQGFSSSNGVDSFSSYVFHFQPCQSSSNSSPPLGGLLPGEQWAEYEGCHWSGWHLAEGTSSGSCNIWFKSSFCLGTHNNVEDATASHTQFTSSIMSILSILSIMS